MIGGAKVDTGEREVGGRSAREATESCGATERSHTARRGRMSKGERRKVLLEAARVAFLRSGRDGGTVREVAELSGVSEAVIYRHFASKDELYEEAVVNPLEEAVGRVKSLAESLPFDAGGSPHRAVTEAFVRDLLGILKAHIGAFGIVLFADGRKRKEFYLRRVRPLLEELEAMVRRNLATWRHREFDPKLLVRAVFGMCVGIALDAELAGEEFDPAAVASDLVAVMFSGLLPRPEEGKGIRKTRMKRNG